MNSESFCERSQLGTSRMYEFFLGSLYTHSRRSQHLGPEHCKKKIEKMIHAYLKNMLRVEISSNMKSLKRMMSTTTKIRAVAQTEAIGQFPDFAKLAIYCDLKDLASQIY
jgi:hypothetical protein